MQRPARTLAEACRQPAFRSLWYERLRRQAGSGPPHDWLIDQANLRGFHGAYNSKVHAESPDRSLTDEELLVGLLSPHAPADGRTLKLVVRMLQSSRLNPRRLELLARRERASGVLHWLLRLIPESERTESVRELQKIFATPPRGDRGVAYDYDPQRLVRRPATREQLWRTKPV